MVRKEKNPTDFDEEVPIEKEEKIIRLNLGSGFKPESGEEWINIDKREITHPDIVHDIEIGLPFNDNSVSEIRAFDIMEHWHPDKIPFVMSEIHRVLKIDGFLHFFIPSTDGRGWAMDPTHRSFWNINSWLYYIDPDWHALYPELPMFRAERIQDVCLNERLRIIHTEGKVYPVK